MEECIVLSVHLCFGEALRATIRNGDASSSDSVAFLDNYWNSLQGCHVLILMQNRRNVRAILSG
jgi:hypothetical protein